MKDKHSFSFRERARSFVYAWEGILAFFRSEHNAMIHLVLTAAVFIAAFLLRASPGEWIALVLAMGFVWVAELFNTVVETMMDHLSPQKDPRVKYIKDLSAAAVLLAAITAALTGLLVFIPKFM